MPFRYLRDPLCITAFSLYWLNRFLVKPFTDASFIHHHFNDLICIPLFVPLVVLAARLCRFRSHDQPPRIHEILLPLLVWSIMFELLLPQHPFWSRYVVGDPFDILWYSVGAFIASTWWRHYYPAEATTPRPISRSAGQDINAGATPQSTFAENPPISRESRVA